MKLLVLCLFAVCCWSLVSASARDPRRRRLEEIRSDLDKVKNKLRESGHMFYTPPQDIEDCCSLSVLQCFRENVNVHLKTNDKFIQKLSNNLQKRTVENTLNFCGSTNTTAPHCQACNSYPQKNAEEFFSRLESFIQQGAARLNRK